MLCGIMQLLKVKALKYIFKNKRRKKKVTYRRHNRYAQLPLYKS